MSNCNSCPSKKSCQKQSTSCGVKNNPNNNIKKIIAVMSGKGGVGKSTVTALIAKKLNKMGYKVGILDSDITGPSIPRLMKLQNQRAMSNGKEIYPIESKDGIKTMSINYMVDNENQPIVWKGPMIDKAVKQFYSDVIWGELDYLLIDMPPGTGDVALTVFQSLPVDEVVMVTTPQDLVSLIVAKAVNMCNIMNIKMLGLVENMSYIKCNCCDNIIYPFGKSHLEEVASNFNTLALDRLPINPETAVLVDKGMVEDADASVLDNTVDTIINR